MRKAQSHGADNNSLPGDNPLLRPDRRDGEGPFDNLAGLSDRHREALVLVGRLAVRD
jgi:hypothetical protein